MMCYRFRKILKRLKGVAVYKNGLSLQERESLLNNAIQSGKKIAICVCDGFGNSEKYRCYNLMDVTKNSENWQVVYFDLSEYGTIKRSIDKTSLLVFVRMSFSSRAKKLIRTARQRNIKLLYDIDDLLLNCNWLPELLDGLDVKSNVEKNYWKDLVADYEKLALLVDGFTTTNEYLAKKLEQSFDKPVKVIRNSLNHEQIEISERWVKKKEDRKKVEKVMEKPRQFSIGYFSGSPTHARDFQLIENELIRFLNYHDDAILKVVGYMDFSNNMKEMINSRRVEIIGVVDYLRLQELMSKVDVNIAPLVINDFTNCKSELKFFEAGVVETTTIASPTFSFKKAISDGENGLLAKPGEWYSKLEYLYGHPMENTKMARNAKEYALKHYYGKEFLREVEEVYGYFTN